MRRIRSAPTAALVLAALAAGLLATASPASAAKAKKPATVTVMVTNDDGVGAPGIDVLVEALRKQKNTKVVVVAPATNQTGKGATTTPGPLTTATATTASGYKSTAVQGTPADTITAALDQLGVKPNVVMSGINVGQNLAGRVGDSGTIGAAKAAVLRGIPAVAFSQGFTVPTETPQFESAAKLAVKWLAKHRSELAKKPKTAPTAIVNYNVPNCPSGSPRGVKVVETGSTVDGIFDGVDCASTITDPTTDTEAFNAGWAAEATVPAT
jgi:5'/3'-nucleotidase